ncbi:hypothetical protein MNEG_11861 [Monoraphidium neglectum]|uniref:Uncharacterized protein n=1 Tax=Monoraphidium neglectum TaxID=145388 RepID=A0A0D2MMX8_9CHLO|nr:hypothetical protein MNEG_11861 [Monoraphidium neglectum]KIY96100.1 hypothetical protein MNEG_11861 [Monoraphidium neglectum]|eukprot:XP_013895120.1 hypothetical protein MNEG_11861 [Monoraphidium neglectum]
MRRVCDALPAVLGWAAGADTPAAAAAAPEASSLAPFDATILLWSLSHSPAQPTHTGGGRDEAPGSRRRLAWGLAAAALRRQQELGAADVATLAWSLAKALGSPQAPQQHLHQQQHPQQQQQEQQQQQQQQQQQRRRPEASTPEEAAVLQALQEAIQLRRGAFSRPQILLLARAAPRLGLWRPQLWTHLAHGAAANAACFDPGDLPRAAAAFAPAARRLAPGPPRAAERDAPSDAETAARALRQVYRDLGRAALCRLPELRPAAAAALAAAFAGAGQPHDALADVLAGAAADGVAAGGAQGWGELGTGRLRAFAGDVAAMGASAAARERLASVVGVV